MTSSADSPVDLLGLRRDELESKLEQRGLKRVHAVKVWRHLHRDGRTDWEAIDGLPRELVELLRTEMTAGLLPVAHETHSDGALARKYLLELDDQRQIETVLMRYAGRVTACLSSQAGCAMGCTFCATGQMGFGRHLTAAEIVAQALHVDAVLRSTAADAPPLSAHEHRSPHHRHARLSNVVLMGMGEPLHNYDAVIQATQILCDTAGLAISPKKVTLSTVGVVPGIIRLADERQPFHLAVSLHAATQEGREALVPVAKKWPLHELMSACRYYASATGRRILFEWTLIDGQNDRPEDAHAVGSLLAGLPSHVNLIPLNPTDGFGGAPSDLAAARRFQATLAEHHIPSTVRARRGIDIAAGCGQLVSLNPSRSA